MQVLKDWIGVERSEEANLPKTRPFGHKGNVLQQYSLLTDSLNHEQTVHMQLVLVQ